MVQERRQSAHIGDTYMHSEAFTSTRNVKSIFPQRLRQFVCSLNNPHNIYYNAGRKAEQIYGSSGKTEEAKDIFIQHSQSITDLTVGARVMLFSSRQHRLYNYKSVCR